LSLSKRKREDFIIKGIEHKIIIRPIRYQNDIYNKDIDWGK